MVSKKVLLRFWYQKQATFRGIDIEYRKILNNTQPLECVRILGLSIFVICACVYVYIGNSESPRVTHRGDGDVSLFCS